jgi:RNA recognition motif-containing protein
LERLWLSARVLPHPDHKASRTAFAFRGGSPSSGHNGGRRIPNKVFVGNLSFDVTREELLEAFSGAGRVVDAKVPTDRETGRPRGFAFIEFETDEAAQRCIETMNGRELRGRAMRINAADDRPRRPPGAGPAFRPSPGPRPFRPGGPSSEAPLFERDSERGERGEGRGRRFRQKPSRKPSQKRRRRDSVVDDDEY